MLSFALPQLGQNQNNCLSPSTSASHSAPTSASASTSSLSSLPLQHTPSRFAAGRFSKSFAFIDCGIRGGGDTFGGTVPHVPRVNLHIKIQAANGTFYAIPQSQTRECNNESAASTQKKGTEKGFLRRSFGLSFGFALIS